MTPEMVGLSFAYRRSLNNAFADGDADVAEVRKEARANYALYEQGIEARDQLIMNRDTEIASLKQAIEKLVAKSQRDQSVVAGLDAFIDTVVKLSPNCEALVETDDKSEASKAYVMAFDKKASDLGAPHLIEERKAADAKKTAV